MSAEVISTLRYANADSEALRTEKAYILNYTAPPGLPKSNFKIDFVPDIKIRNLRTAGLAWEESGIRIAKLPGPGSLPRKEFEDEAKIENYYLPIVHDCLKETLGAEEVCIFDYMVRRREPAFPYQPKSKDNAPQPALSAHIDYTTDEISGRVSKYFKDKAAVYASRHYQIVK
ncbi:hypothetical protein LY76DRAFT_317682 [Colletotrichum caudatum]|nr:hypothetical protein LY76DRAFT_317682 [Colletotrichum caudatum]